MVNRVNYADIQMAFSAMRKKLEQKIAQYGNVKFHSPHECLGVVTEEHYELISAVHRNDPDEFRSECMDVAIAAFWSFLSIAPSPTTQEQAS